MKIRMLQTHRGTQDGHIVEQFQRGKTYEVRNNLARNFFAAGVAVLVNDSLRNDNPQFKSKYTCF